MIFLFPCRTQLKLFYGHKYSISIIIFNMKKNFRLVKGKEGNEDYFRKRGLGFDFEFVDLLVAKRIPRPFLSKF